MESPTPSKYGKGYGQTLGRLQIPPSPQQRIEAEEYSPEYGDAMFRSVYDWAESMSPTNDEYECDDFSHIKQFWGGRGSLWKPVSNMDRISRQEQRHRQMTLRVSMSPNIPAMI